MPGHYNEHDEYVEGAVEETTLRASVQPLSLEDADEAGGVSVSERLSVYVPEPDALSAAFRRRDRRRGGGRRRDVYRGAIPIVAGASHPRHSVEGDLMRWPVAETRDPRLRGRLHRRRGAADRSAGGRHRRRRLEYGRRRGRRRRLVACLRQCAGRRTCARARRRDAGVSGPSGAATWCAPATPCTSSDVDEMGPRSPCCPVRAGTSRATPTGHLDGAGDVLRSVNVDNAGACRLPAWCSASGARRRGNPTSAPGR